MTATANAFDLQFQLLDSTVTARARVRPNDLTRRPVLLPDPKPIVPGESDAVRHLRASLDATVARRLLNGSELIRAIATRTRNETLPTTLDGLDRLLGGGLMRGKLIELVSRRATGRFSIVLSALAAATSMGEAAALVDLGDHFDPQIAEANGVDLRRLLWIRPTTLKQAVMSGEMITATGFQLVIVDVGLHPLRGRRVPDAAWVRLARTAEAQGTAMLISTPYPLTGTASEAVVTGDRSRPRWLGRGRGPRLLGGVELGVALKKHRHLRPGSVANVELQTFHH